jgi:phosphohistidine phosphatase
MPELILFRHAKSSWSIPELDDFDRPLSARGLRDAPVMAQRVKHIILTDTLLISSPANRAASTARAAARIWEYPLNAIQFVAELYQASASEIWQLVRQLPASNKQLVLFGHNEGFSDLLQQCAADSELELPTAGVVWLSFECEEWSGVVASNSRIKLLDYPKKKAL